MSEASTAVTRSLGEAASASARLVERCIDHAVAELQEAELHAERSDTRKELAAAWRELQVQKPRWALRFPQLLKAAFESAGSGRKEGEGTQRPLSLTLVDESEVAQTVESARLTQQLTAMLERPLSELDALMSSALGLDGIQPERNPLRPEVYAQTLRKMVGEARPEPAWPALWLRHMTKPLAHELEQLYRDQAHLLTLARVQAANYKLRATPSRPAPLMPADGPRGAGAASGQAPLGGSSGFAPLGGQPAAGGHSGQAPLGGHSGFAGLGAASGQAPLAPGEGSAPLAPTSGPSAPAEPPLVREFLLRGAAQAELPPPSSYYAAIEAELAALEASPDTAPYDPRAARQHMHLPPVDRPQRHIGTDSPLPQETWGTLASSRQRSLVRSRLKKEARQLGQVYGLEVVRALVDQVAQDPRLLAPVREAIVGLEPSLLRLSMVAPRFFSDEDHPGRLLLEKVAERSFKFNDEFSVEFQGFFGPVAHAFRRLNAQEEFADAEPFRQVLAQLQAGWSAQDALDAEEERKVLQAVQFAERRQVEADRIATDLARRPDLAGVPDEVRDFLLKRWTLVIAHARLNEPHKVDPGSYLAVVADLLWSVNRDLTLHEPAHAFELIPRVLLKLRAGLAMLGEQPEDSAAFFHQLELLHRPVMKLRARQRHRELPVPEPEEPPPSTRPPERGPDHLWMADAELRAAGFDDTNPSQPAPLAGSHAAHAHAHSHAHAPAPAAPLAEAEAEHLLARIVVGSWVDLHSRQHWRRARLTWTSENGAFYMFTSHGGQPHSMTRRSLQRLLRDHLLRPVEADAVVPRALEQLAQQRLPLAHAGASPR